MLRSTLMTVLEIIDNARDLLAEPLDATRVFPDDSSSFWRDSQLLRYFNNEQQIVSNHLVQTYEHYFVTSTSINIVNGTKEYTLPSDFKKATRLENFENSSNPTEIVPISINDIVNNGSIFDSERNGSVEAYSINGNSFIFSPRPNQSKASGVRVYYEKRLADFSSASSISEIPKEFHELLVWGTVKRALFQQESGGESYIAAAQEYNRLLKELKKQAEDRQVQRPRKVKRKRGF